MNRPMIQDEIYNIMNDKPNGLIFLTSDFLDLASSETIRKALKRLVDSKLITRIFDGMYSILEYSNVLGKEVYPSADKFAQAIARKFGWSIYPSSNTSLNIVGISTQIPNKYEYISDGPYRKYEYIGNEISFKRTSSNKLKGYSNELINLISAFNALGKDNIDSNHMLILASYTKNNIKEDITKNTKSLPEWIYSYLKLIKETLQND